MKSNTKRRLNWAATLALLLTLLPNGLTAAAADTYSLHVGGVEITSENLTVSGDTGMATYDPDSHTLTLDNYSYTGAGYSSSGEGGGIDYRGGTDLTIVLNGSNSIVKSSVSTPDRSHGIYYSCSGKTLTISGEGSLDISFQSASSGIWKRNGIFCEPGAFVMESGTVTSAGGTADESAGIYTDDGITINGGTFTGIGNPTTAYESRGIYSGSITVNGGKAIGRATNTDKTAYAFQGDVTVNGGELTASASTDSGEAKAFSWDSCEVAGELLEMEVGDSAESAVATTNPDDVSGKRYAYIKTTPLPSYTATFDANGGEGIMDAISGLKGHQITFPANVFSAPIGKTFNGWSDGESTYQPGESYTLAANVTFSAIWADIVTVTFDSNGGGAVDSQTIPKNASAEKPKAPARDGFIFRGWELDGTSYDFSSPVAQDITLAASWIEGLSVAADFEDGAFPDGWTQEGNGGWSVGTGDYNDGTGAHGGSRNAKITHSDNGNETWLIMPAQDLSGKSAVSLSFWYINRSWGSDIDAFGAYYRLDGGDWTELFATTEAHGGWTEWSGTLPDAALDPNVEIGFRMTDNFGFGVGLDDVSLESGGHSWSYAAEGAAIIATCQNDPCDLGENRSLSLTLTESGTAVALDGLDAFNAATGLAVSESDIQYYSGETLLSETPSGLGSYTAKLTVQGVTASKAFQISEPVSYQDAAWNETTQSVDFTEKTATSYTPVTSDSTSWTDGWYVVDSDVTLSDRITVTGNIHLVLADGKTLTASKGIMVTSGNTLEIYGQSDGTGTLNAASSGSSAIGVGDGWGSPAVGDIVIYGGNVTATGNTGIGYSTTRVNQMAGTLTVYGGTVVASTNADGAGIGGAWNDAGLKTVTVYGGSVTANGGVRAAGIGGGCQNRDNPSSGKGGDVYIYGGTVIAKVKDGTTYGGEGKTPVAIGKGDGGSEDGSITLGRYVTLYGGTSESDLVTIASPYTDRYKYMKAVYDPPVAAVTFDANGHGTAPDLMTGVASGSTIAEPDAPTETGYDFGGWYKDADCTTAWDFSADTVTEDIILYAKWTLSPATAPTISTQPQNLPLTYGYTEGSVSVTATAATDTTYNELAYQWYSNTTSSNEGGTAITENGTSVTYTIPTGKNAGTTEYYYCVVTAARTDNGETASGASDPVTLTVNKRAVTLTSATDSKVYDGAALTNDEVTVSGDGFIDGEGASYNVTGTQTLPGCSANTFTYTLNSGTNADNYEITTVNGTLTVTDRNAPNTEEPDDPDKKYEITVTANSDTVLYDGTEHSVSGFETLEYTFDNVTYTVSGLSAEVTGTDARTYPVTVTGTAVVKDPSGNDLTAQFIVNTVDGSLTIDKRSVTLTSATKSREYNGSALTNDTVNVSGDGWATGEGAEYSVTGTQKIVGSSSNSFTYTLNSGTKADNYDITVTLGTLTVTSRTAKYEISPQANSDTTVKYDGQAHTVSGFVTDSFTVEGNSYAVSGLTASATETNAGTYNVSVDGTAVVTDSDGNDVSSEFSVTPQTGTLAISKREVTLTSATAEKEYDGTSLTDDTVTVSGDGFAAGEGALYDVTGTRTLAGASENTFTYTLNDNTSADNYTITTAYGNLTVKNRNAKYTVTLTANSGEFLYDGAEKTVSGWTIDGTAGGTFTASNGLQYTVSGMTAEAKRTDAGTYTINVTGTPVVKDSGGNDVTAQFAVSTESGALTISKRNVTLTSGSLRRVYNGAALTNETVMVGGDGWATGEGAAYTVTGSQTLPGNSANAFTYTLNSGTNADNYEITTVTGTLTVTNRTSAGSAGDTRESRKYEITLTANSGAFLYDGMEHSVSGFETLEYTFDGVTYTVSGVIASAKATNAGETDVVITGTPVIKVKDGGGTDLAAQFIVNQVPGRLTITKAAPEYTAPVGLTSAYGLTLADVALPSGWAWDNPSANVGNAGTNSFPATFTPSDTDNYNTVSEMVSVTVSKATWGYTVPTGLTATYGDTLSDVALPSGWAWDNPAASVGDAGISSFSVTFTPSDTRNYNTVTETVSVTVNKAAPDAGQLPSAVSSLVYDGAAHTLVTSGSSGGGVYRYRLGPDGAWSEALPSAVEAGNYTVYYYLAGDKNHLDLGSASAPLGSVSTVIASPEMPVISGKVLRAEDGTEIGGATVRLMRGSEEAASAVTAQDGAYQLTAEPGLYNIVVEWTNSVETLTKTEMIMVSGGTTKDVYVSSGRVNSVLEVMPETPSVIVGGLDAEAQTVKEVDGGSIVTVRMVVERSADDGDTSAIQSAAAGQDVDSFEIRVEKTVDSVTTPLKQTMTELELVIPFSFGGKENVTIYRIHDDSVTAMTESASGEDATFWLDRANSFIHVYANRFSTYAVAYTQCYNITGTIAYGDYTGTVTVLLVERGREDPAASKEISLSSGMGAYSFTHIPKGTYTLTAKWLDGEMETALNKEIEVH